MTALRSETAPLVVDHSTAAGSERAEVGRRRHRWAAGRPARATAVVVAVGGSAATVALAIAASMPAGEAGELIGWAAGTAALGAVVGAFLLRVLRGRSVALQVAALAGSSTVTVSLGAWLGARAMFLSSHDLAALAVLLGAAGTVGCVTTLLLGDRVERASASLVEATRRLGAGEPVEAVSPVAGLAGETARLARELERTATRLDEARARERALDASRRELFAWMSHDLRTPLAGIRAIAEALEDGVVEDPAARVRYHATLREEAERLAGLVDDLFELTRAEAGAPGLELGPVAMADLVSDAVAGVAPLASAAGVHLVAPPVPDGPSVHGAVPELLRVLRNLLDNAIRHTPAGGTIAVAVTTRAGRAQVSVTDCGGGIRPDDLARVFEAGFRSDAARSPGGGTGLGLAIARSLVQAHDGTITVANVSGGARFTVELPLEPGANAGRTSGAGAASA